MAQRGVFNPQTINPILAFNRGRVSRLALARVDLQAKLPWGAEIQTNWMPRTLGSMMLRPGLQYTGYGTHNNAYAVHIPFVRASDDVAIIELTDNIMRVKINEIPITRPSVATAIVNGTFNANLTSWTDADESGGTSAWVAGGYMGLTGNGTNSAIRYQAVTVSGGDIGVEHALNISVLGMGVRLRVGSSSTADDYINEVALGEGVHSLSFTPAGTFYIQFSNKRLAIAYVDSVAVASAGIMTLVSPWDETNLDSVTWDESVDVIYVGCDGLKPYKIERIGNARSWSIVEYFPEDGPFRNINISNITLAGSALTGNATLTASKAFFYATHVGSLFRLDSNGQIVQQSLSASDTYTDSIRITGVAGNRLFTFNILGTWSGTLTLQQSFDNSTWQDTTTPVDWSAITTNGPRSFNDTLANQIVYYRIGFKPGAYVSGTADINLTYNFGSITGIVRVTGYSSSTSVSVAVIKALGGTSATLNWYEGEWSSRRGFPMAVGLHEGRLWWAGNIKYFGSVSGAYESYDDTVEGDSAPINKTIPYGPVDTINWMLPVKTLLMGTASLEWSIRSSTLEEVITPSNVKAVSTSSQGSIPVEVIKVDTNGIFVQQSGTKIYTTGYDPIKENYITDDLTKFIPEIGLPGIVRIDVQRQPDTRIHNIRSDGTCAVLVSDDTEDVRCWVDVETPGADGEIEDVFMLPGTEETKVYYCVKRTIGGVTKRYLERWAKESECVGGTLNKQADSFIIYSGSPTATITGLGHLEGQEVIVWGDGQDLSDGYDDDQVTYTVTSAQITGLPSTVSHAIVGLPYSARYKSTKLAYGGVQGTALNQKKKVDHLGLILADTHAKGLRFGPDEDNLDAMPDMEEDTLVGDDDIYDQYDKDMIEFDGEWTTDSRIFLKAQAPRPCTVLALTVKMQTN